MSAPGDNALGLADLQAWLQHAITAAPALTLTEAAAATVVRRSSRMNAVERLGVYRDAYFARLHECLADDYPALRALLGHRRFATVCHAYIAAHAPRSASLNGYGAGLSDFCTTAPFREQLDGGPPFDLALLRDVARLEWASVELIHAPVGIPLTGAEILRHQARFGEARLLPVPTLRLVRLDHPVHNLYTSLRAGDAATLPAPAAAPSHELLYRADWQIHCEALTAVEGALLADLLAGTRIATALSRAATRGASEHDIGTYFQRWLGAGFFAAVT
jgi:hypothetical protein